MQFLIGTGICMDKSAFASLHGVQNICLFFNGFIPKFYAKDVSQEYE